MWSTLAKKYNHPTLKKHNHVNFVIFEFLILKTLSKTHNTEHCQTKMYCQLKNINNKN